MVQYAGEMPIGVASRCSKRGDRVVHMAAIMLCALLLTALPATAAFTPIRTGEAAGASSDRQRGGSTTARIGRRGDTSQSFERQSKRTTDQALIALALAAATYVTRRRVAERKLYRAAACSVTA